MCQIQKINLCENRGEQENNTKGDGETGLKTERQITWGVEVYFVTRWNYIYWVEKF